MSRFWIDRHRPAVLIVAFLAPLGWCSLAEQLGRHVSQATSILVLVMVVVAAAASGDRWAGVVTALSAATWFDYELVPPVHTFRITDAIDVEVTVLLAIIGLVVTELTLWGRRQQSKASSMSGYLDGIMTTSRIVAGDLGTDDLVVQVADGLTALLDVDACRFVTARQISARDPVLQMDGTVTIGSTTVDVDRDGLPTMMETLVPARHHGVVRGGFLVTAATRIVRPPLERRRVAALLAHQVGAALVDPQPPTPSPHEV